MALKKSTYTSRAVAGSITSVLQYVFVILLQIILAPVVLRLAGKEIFGAYSVLIQIISWAALTDLGFGVALGRNLSQAHGTDDQHHHFKNIFTTGRTFYIASNLAFAGLILIMSWKLNSFMPMTDRVGYEARIALVLLAIWVVIRTPLALYNDALIATQNLAPVNIIMALGVAVRLILSIGFVISGASLIGLMFANIIGEAVQYLLGFIWYHKLYPHDKFGWGIPDRRLFREMLKFGLTYMVVIVAGRLSANTDSIIVGYLYGASAVSIYYISQVPGTMLYHLIWKLTDNSAPALNELYSKNAVDQLTNAYLRLFRYSLLLVIPLAIGLIGFSRSAITLWVGEAQYAGDIFTGALALFAITQVLIHLNCIVMVAYGDIRVMSIFFLFSGIMKLILAFWLGHLIGLKGVMIANTIVDIFGFVYFNFRVWRILSLTIYEVGRNAVLPALKSSILLLFMLMLMLLKPPSATWLLFLIWVSVFAIVWVLGTAIVGLTAAERDQFKYFIRRKLNLNL